MVTWGANTVHTFGSAPAPAAPGAAPPPAGGGLFGSTPAPAAPAPGAAPTTSLFGTPSTAPAPAPGGSLFGAPAPAPAGGGLFGAPSPAPAGGGLFGTTTPTPAPSLFGGFGTPAPAPSSAFGTTTSLFASAAPTPGAPNSQNAQQIPAQAALQAHMDASARQEAERVRGALERLHAAYSGVALPTSGGEESKFVTIVYNDLTPEQRQLQWIHGMGNGGQILSPPRPPQVSDEVWKKAVVNNPDPQNYMPVALVGAVALQARVSWQQDRAKELATNVATLQKSHETIKERSAKAKQDVEQKARRHAALRRHFLQLMRRVELARCMNQSIQPDEVKAVERLASLLKDIDAARGSLTTLHDKAKTQTSVVAKGGNVADVPERTVLLPVLAEHRSKLEKMLDIAKRDVRDVQLMGHRINTIAPRMHRD